MSISEGGGWVHAANYLHSCLDEVQSDGQGLPHEDVWVVGGLEGLLQLLQLPAAIVGARTPLFHRPLLVWKWRARAAITQSPTGDNKLMVQDWVISTAIIRPRFHTAR